MILIRQNILFFIFIARTRISDQNEQALNEAIGVYDKSIDDIKKELEKSVFVRDMEQTQKKLQLLDLRYTNLVFYRDTIKTEFTQEQGAWLVEIDKAMEIFKDSNDNKFNALFDLYKKETSTGGVVNEKTERLKEAITYIESLIVNIEDSFSGKLDKTLNWIKENFNNRNIFLITRMILISHLMNSIYRCHITMVPMVVLYHKWDLIIMM